MTQKPIPPKVPKARLDAIVTAIDCGAEVLLTPEEIAAALRRLQWLEGLRRRLQGYGDGD